MSRKNVQDFVGHLDFPGGAPRCASAASDPEELPDVGPVNARSEPHPRGASALQEQALLCLSEAELQHMREIAAL